MSRGSTWNKWDFHLHSPFSILNNQFGDPDDEQTWERYVSTIESQADELGIVAIGITDYFTIDGYKRLRQYQDEGRLANILLFPNIEFRVREVIYRSRKGTDPKRLNFHVLFSSELPAKLIEEHFLHDLNFTHENDPQSSAQKRRLKRDNLEEFGETLRNQHPPFQNRSALEIGCMNATVSVDEIKRKLEEDGRFAGKYLLILADEDLSLMDWDGQDHATRKQLLQMSHGVLSSNEKTRQFCLGEFHDSEEAFVDEFKSLKPCIWGCDSHGFSERFLLPDQERFCWIKAEVSWEGLKQILYEPAERVRIQRDSPEPQKSIYTLDAVKVSGVQVNPALSIADLTINLNRNLVAIIGGRGSGKTALLDLIAACFPEGQKLSGIESSFYRRLYVAQGRQSEMPAPIPVSVHFRSDKVFEKRIGEENTIFDLTDVSSYRTLCERG